MLKKSGYIVYNEIDIERRNREPGGEWPTKAKVENENYNSIINTGMARKCLQIADTSLKLFSLYFRALF